MRHFSLFRPIRLPGGRKCILSSPLLIWVVKVRGDVSNDASPLSLELTLLNRNNAFYFNLNIYMYMYKIK
jgi:hypothetical protein